MLNEVEARLCEIDSLRKVVNEDRDYVMSTNLSDNKKIWTL
jgi:hypothetical protein